MTVHRSLIGATTVWLKSTLFIICYEHTNTPYVLLYVGLNTMSLRNISTDAPASHEHCKIAQPYGSCTKHTVRHIQYAETS